MDAFPRKLRAAGQLTPDDERLLAELCVPARWVARGADIQPEASQPRSIPLVLEGWACRYKLLANGKRQIVSLLLPGDLAEPFGAVPSVMDHSLAALTPVLVAHLVPASIRDAATSSPRIEHALWWDLLVTDAMLRERVISMGRRSATERLGHLFCELQVRTAMVTPDAELSFDMPLTQADLADLLGLSAVHVNRSLQELRKMRLLSLGGRRLDIHDLPTLRDVSLFDPTYLSA